MNNFITAWDTNAEYFEALKILASLSGLFADSTIPYLDYRLAENVFCRYFNAENEARSCTAYDAKINAIGIGIKTFILKNNQSTEKIAEFNKLKPQLDNLNGIDLARKLGEFRNARIQVADNMYGTSSRLYHIVGRSEGILRIFNTSYDCIDIDNIQIMHNDIRRFSFHDGQNEYFFNRSKSVLIKRFSVPSCGAVDVPIEIINDPLSLLVQIFGRKVLQEKGKAVPQTDTTASTANVLSTTPRKAGFDYVILPLYSTRGHQPTVPQKSGLNQWNAGGRKRDPNEVYIPIPIKIHQMYPDFFPPRDEHFTLNLPDGSNLSAKVCQDNGKALMSTHNADLGEWILRKVLHKREGELVTMDDFYRFGIDSVCIVNEHSTDLDGKQVYSISFTSADYESYAEFAEDEE